MLPFLCFLLCMFLLYITVLLPVGVIIAKFHYTDPTRPARTQRSFAAKKVRAGPVGSMSVSV